MGIPTITSVTPDQALPLANEYIVVEGTNFSESVHLYIGDLLCRDIEVQSSTHIRCKPPRLRGNYSQYIRTYLSINKNAAEIVFEPLDVTVINLDGDLPIPTEIGVLEEGFTYHTADKTSHINSPILQCIRALIQELELHVHHDIGLQTSPVYADADLEMHKISASPHIGLRFRLDRDPDYQFLENEPLQVGNVLYRKRKIVQLRFDVTIVDSGDGPITGATSLVDKLVEWCESTTHLQLPWVNDPEPSNTLYEYPVELESLPQLSQNFGVSNVAIYTSTLNIRGLSLLPKDPCEILYDRDYIDLVMSDKLTGSYYEVTL